MTLETATTGGLSPTTRVRFAGRRILRHGKYFVGHYPDLLPVLLRLTPQGTARRITAETDLVIEGFPRSGNTFAVRGLQYVYGDSIHIASHVHHPSQIKKAIESEVPCLLVVRTPIEALASYLIAGPHGRPTDVVREYADYHEEVEPLADRLLVATFSQVTKDLPRVVSRLRDRFGLEMHDFELTPADEDAIFEHISDEHRRHHPKEPIELGAARPSVARRELNARIRAVLESPAYAEGLRHCDAVYERLALRAQ